jgi:hypothetical protein
VDSRDKRPSRRKGSLSDVAGHQTHAPAPHFYGKLVGVDAINGDEIRQNFFGYRNFVIGEIQEMQNVALCRWGSGIPGEACKYSGTDLLEERDGRMTIFYTFIDGHSPMSFSTE